MEHRSTTNQRVIAETAAKMNHRIITDQPSWQLVLIPDLKDALKLRLKEHGYMCMGHGTRQVLKLQPLGVRAKQPPEPDKEPGQSIPWGHWGGH